MFFLKKIENFTSITSTISKSKQPLQKFEIVTSIITSSISFQNQNTTLPF